MRGQECNLYLKHKVYSIGECFNSPIGNFLLLVKTKMLMSFFHNSSLLKCEDSQWKITANKYECVEHLVLLLKVHWFVWNGVMWIKHCIWSFVELKLISLSEGFRNSITISLSILASLPITLKFYLCVYFKYFRNMLKYLVR